MATKRTRAAAAEKLQQNSAPVATGLGDGRSRTPNAQNSAFPRATSNSPRAAKLQKTSSTFQAANPEENGQLLEDGATAIHALMSTVQPAPVSIPSSLRSGTYRRGNASTQEESEDAVMAEVSAAEPLAEEASTLTRPGQLKPVGNRTRLVDRQDGAEKVTFESQGAEEISTATRTRGRKSKALIAADALDNPVSDDVGFQIDQRPSHAAPRRRAQQIKQSQSQDEPPPVVIPTAQMTHSQPETQQDAETDEPINDGEGVKDETYVPQEPDEEDGDNGSSEQVETYFNEVGPRAKLAVAAVDKGGPQIRVAWSLEETKALLGYIEKFGVSWAKIKRQDAEKDNALWQRNQGAIKDKARNMKFEYLKASYRLPKNFEHIRLAQPMINKLSQMGITYEQQRQRNPPTVPSDS